VERRRRGDGIDESNVFETKWNGKQDGKTQGREEGKERQGQIQ